MKELNQTLNQTIISHLYLIPFLSTLLIRNFNKLPLIQLITYQLANNYKATFNSQILSKVIAIL